MEYRWRPPLRLDVNGKSIVEFKPKQEWDKLDNKGTEANARAFFSIFNGVCLNKFRRIANCTHAKEASDIL